MASTLFFAGTSGMVFAEPNKSAFPPAFRDKSRLVYYASLFNSLEVNSSFYKVPQAATVARWASEAPDGFRFTFKLWRDITHARDLAYKKEAVQHFMQVIALAGHRKGCLLLQFPPSLTITQTPALTQLLDLIVSENTATGWRLALEFRHPSWYVQATYQLAEKFGAAIVLHDMPKSVFQEVATSAPFVYLRFHGPAGDYKGGYPDALLQQYADKVAHWMAAGKTVYVYFNNTIGDALQNVYTLRHLVKGQAPHPTLTLPSP